MHVHVLFALMLLLSTTTAAGNYFRPSIDVSFIFCSSRDL